jgi:hypothetical protein
VLDPSLRRSAIGHSKEEGSYPKTIRGALGYAFEAGGEPFVDLDDEAALATIVRRRASLRALHPAAGEVDLLLSVAGYSYPSKLSTGATG